jgi:hypothetical protein
LGWLLKGVLADDRRAFEEGRAGMVKVYRWVRASAGGEAPDAEPGAAPDPAAVGFIEAHCAVLSAWGVPGRSGELGSLVG